MQGHPRQTGQSEEFRQNVFLWRRQWQTTPVFSLQEPMKNMKRQKDKTLEDEPPPVGRCPVYYWRRMEQTPGDGEEQGSLACGSPRGQKESDMT